MDNSRQLTPYPNVNLRHPLTQACRNFVILCEVKGREKGAGNLTIFMRGNEAGKKLGLGMDMRYVMSEGVTSKLRQLAPYANVNLRHSMAEAWRKLATYEAE